MPLSSPPADALDVPLCRVRDVWRGNGVRPSVRAVYQRWAQRFILDCRQRGAKLEVALTLCGAAVFMRRYSLVRVLDRQRAWTHARPALRALSWGLAALGYSVSPWRPAPERRSSRLPLVREFAEYRRTLRGVSEATSRKETDTLDLFGAFLRARRGSFRSIRICDVDAYVVARRRRVGRRTVAGECSILRAFLRFLHATGRMRFDLSASVLSPLVRAAESPPRALPWKAVRRILGAVDRTTRAGKRDFAMLLMMALYGLGAGEVRSLRLEQIDWAAGVLRVTRPKTGCSILLPLLPPVARALIDYLRHGRPRFGDSRAIFLRLHAPHELPVTSSAIRHAIGKHARVAGVTAPFLGSHALRHSHASRQIELGTVPSVVGAILGHRRTESTSVYTRAALRHLKRLALPVPG